MQKDNTCKYNNILVDAVMHLGDLIHATTIIPLLKSTFPGTKVSFLVPSNLVEVFDLIDDVEYVIPYSYKSGRDYFNVYKMAQKIKKYNFDLSISLDPRMRLSSMMWLAGIPTRVGSPSVFGWEPGLEKIFFSDYVKFYDYDIRKHSAAENFQQLIRIFANLGNVDSDNFIRPFFKKADPSSDKYVGDILADLHKDNIKIALCVKTVDEARNWDPDNFSKIIKKLNSSYSCDFVFVGVNGDKDSIEKICSGVGKDDNLFHAEGRTNLKQLNALLRKMDFLVNLDNGMGHFAAAAGCPTVTIFSNADPWKFKPLHEKTKIVFCACDCRENCNKHSRKKCNYECLNSININDVYKNVVLFIKDMQNDSWEIK